MIDGAKSTEQPANILNSWHLSRAKRIPAEYIRHAWHSVNTLLSVCINTMKMEAKRKLLTIYVVLAISVQYQYMFQRRSSCALCAPIKSSILYSSVSFWALRSWESFELDYPHMYLPKRKIDDNTIESVLRVLIFGSMLDVGVKRRRRLWVSTKSSTNAMEQRAEGAPEGEKIRRTVINLNEIVNLLNTIPLALAHKIFT